MRIKWHDMEKNRSGEKNLSHFHLHAAFWSSNVNNAPQIHAISMYSMLNSLMYVFHAAEWYLSNFIHSHNLSSNFLSSSSNSLNEARGKSHSKTDCRGFFCCSINLDLCVCVCMCRSYSHSVFCNWNGFVGAINPCMGISYIHVNTMCVNCEKLNAKSCNSINNWIANQTVEFMLCAPHIKMVAWKLFNSNRFDGRTRTAISSKMRRKCKSYQHMDALGAPFIFDFFNWFSPFFETTKISKLSVRLCIISESNNAQ